MKNRKVEGTTKQDGDYTIGYFSNNQAVNQLASTTGNKSGIYDMSGGAWEYVMGYTTAVGATDQSGFNAKEDNSKYYNTYSSSRDTEYNNRILGDATGEMGPFGSEEDPNSSWYKDYADFVELSYPWFIRGGTWSRGTKLVVYLLTFLFVLS